MLLLHGADGLNFNAERYRSAAQGVAALGYEAYLLHYLDRTGQVRAEHATIARNFPAWSQTVRDALTFVESQPPVDPTRLGLIGTSLGAALAIAVAAVDSRICALVDHFGFLPEGLRAGAVRMPPTLVLHGAKDVIVPVSNAYALRDMLQRLEIEHEFHVYPDQAHGFRGAALMDAAARTAAFLARHLTAAAADRQAPVRS